MINVNEEQLDFFFWLGNSDKPEPLTEEQFEERIKAKQEAERKWRNVEVDG